MPAIRPISSIRYAAAREGKGADLSDVIAPPYDVLDEESKAALLERSDRNIVAIDLPHLPPKTVGPDSAYKGAGDLYRKWLKDGILAQDDKPAIYIYQQTYVSPSNPDQQFKRRGVIANVKVQPFGGSGKKGFGGVHPHEQTFSAPKEDRLKLMQATASQLSPIFGIYSDDAGGIQKLIDKTIGKKSPTFQGTTSNDDVLHEVWQVTTKKTIDEITRAMAPLDVYIADGHHRYNTALNYQEWVKGQKKKQPDADWCMFVLVALQDPGMIVQPTHRVLGGMQGFNLKKLMDVSAGKMKIKRFMDGFDLEALEAALPKAGPHAMGLYLPQNSDAPLWLLTTEGDDPLAATHGDKSEAWRKLDVAILQELFVQQICQPAFCPKGGEVTWKFPHTLDQVRAVTADPAYQLGVLVQPTPLESVVRVSQAGELMPQKSTFFYPKLATGLVINPLS